MKTTVIESNTAKNNEVKNANPVTAENKNPQFVAGNPVNKDSAKPEAEKGKEAPKAEAPKVQEQPKAEPVKAEATQAEPAKAEVKTEPFKPVRNLTETIKVLEELHRLTVQRNKLLATIDNLETFEVELKEDFDETEGNYYQGCSLTIEDDNRRKFTTKNPVIIWTVAQQINSLCVDKLAEVEARIVITA
jgi:hypothetical protein